MFSLTVNLPGEHNMRPPRMRGRAPDIKFGSQWLQNRVVVAHSARNRLSGLISRVIRDTVLAQSRDPGRAAQIRVTAQPRSRRRTRPGARDARCRRRQGHQHLRRDPQEQLSPVPGPGGRYPDLLNEEPRQMITVML